MPGVNRKRYTSGNMPENPSDAPAPEVLQPAADSAQPPTAEDPAGGDGSKPARPPRHLTYRPSHKATFIGLAVVIGILVINGVVFFFLLKGGDNANKPQQNEVTISSEQLSKLGVNKTAVGDLGTQLVIGPDSRFNGKVTVGNDVNISGQLKLNNKITATTGQLSTLEAGASLLSSLNVNGETTLSNATVRGNLAVAGVTQLQGAVSISNNLNVIGNLTVGGGLFAGQFQANNLASGNTFTIGGHVITVGSAPGIVAGGAVGSNGTVSVSGNDASGTVAINTGGGAGGGTMATVTFHTHYDTQPHVVISPIGRFPNGGYYVNRSSTGFSIVFPGAVVAGGYAFDYIVMQ